MQADQINWSTLLEIWDFGLALASRQPTPEQPLDSKKRREWE